MDLDTSSTPSQGTSTRTSLNWSSSPWSSFSRRVLPKLCQRSGREEQLKQLVSAGTASLEEREDPRGARVERRDRDLGGFPGFRVAGAESRRLDR